MTYSEWLESLEPGDPCRLKSPLGDDPAEIYRMDVDRIWVRVLVGEGWRAWVPRDTGENRSAGTRLLPPEPTDWSAA